MTAGVVHSRLHEALLYRQPRHLGRPLDDFGDALHGQGRYRHRLQGHAEVGGELEVAEEIGSEGYHHLEAGAAAEGGAEDGEAEPHLVGVANGEELFDLTDADQDLGLGALLGVADLGGESDRVAAKQPLAWACCKR